MKQWILIDLVSFAIVVALAGIIIPQILLIAFRKNLFDSVDKRKIHRGSVPRLGGIAFFPAVLFSLLMVLGITTKVVDVEIVQDFISNLPSLCFIICAIIILYLIGMADDLIGVKYRAKFVAQIIAAILIYCGGIHLSNLHGLFGFHELPPVITFALTILLTVFITNAINLIDGIDGLASGLSAIACAFYGFVCYTTGLHVFALLSFATLGALVPFFYYNVFGDPEKHRKIFMGDTGALTIGLMLSVLSIRICSMDFGDSVTNLGVVAFAPLLIPCCDVVRVYIHRIKHHQNPFKPDRTHIHHKLLALGMSQRTAMPTIVTASAILTLLNYWVSAHIDITILFLLDLAIWLIANTILTQAIYRKQDRTGEILYK